VCVLACGHAVTPAPSPVPVILAGPTVPAESLRVAATDSFGVALAQHLAPGAAVRVVSDRGALDFIDGGGDVLVTDRPAVTRYASSRADFATTPLPWDRQYALASAYTIPFVDVLDAVHADARLPRQRCMIAYDVYPRRIVYVAGDSIARSVAERYVGTGQAKRAVPLSQEGFDRELATVSDGWYIVTRSADRDSCSLGALRVLPLIETRSQLIVRRGAVGVVADSAGNPRLETRP